MREGRFGTGLKIAFWAAMSLALAANNLALAQPQPGQASPVRDPAAASPYPVEEEAASKPPLGLVVDGAPRVIITPKNFPADTLQGFIAYLKDKKGTAKYGHAGAGSASHVSCILFNAAIGVDVSLYPIAASDRQCRI